LGVKVLGIDLFEVFLVLVILGPLRHHGWGILCACPRIRRRVG
jgi:hypothetical protein